MNRSFNVRHAALLAPWVGLVIAARRPLRDNSFLWHVRAGVDQLETGEVIRSDVYSFTFEGEPWRTQSWLADLLYGWLDGRMGLGFVPWLLLITGVVTFIAVAKMSFARTQSVVATAVGLVLLVWVGVSFLSPRPVLFSYLFLALLVLVVEEDRHSWASLPILWLWAAVHGSWVLGLGLLVLVGLRSRSRRDVVAALLGGVVASLTAHGLAIWGILADFLRNRDALDQITEWAPPTLTSPALAPYAIVVALVLLAAVNGTLERRDLWIVLPFLLFGLTSTRALFPAMLVVTPYAIQALPPLRSNRTGVEPVAVVVGALILALPFVVTPGFGVSDNRFPVEVIDELDWVPTFHDDVSGGYLIYREFDVFVDDRAELYGVEHFTDTSRTRTGRPEWAEVFERWDIEQALLRPDDGLVTVLDGEGWAKTYEDDDFVVFRLSG